MGKNKKNKKSHDNNKNNVPSNHPEKEGFKFNWRFYLVSCAIIEVFLEVAKYYFHGLNYLLAGLVTLLPAFIDFLKNQEANIITYLRKLDPKRKKIDWRKSIFTLIIISSLSFSVVLSAQNNIAARIYTAVNNALLGDSDSAEDNVSSESSITQTEIYEYDDPENVTGDKTEENDYKTFEERLILDSEIEYKLSGELRNEIFFLDGNYRISSWSGSEVQEAVNNFVSYQHERALEPNYAETDVPQSAKDIISNASEAEALLINSPYPTFHQLWSVKDSRTSIYDLFDIYMLIPLIRENYAIFGDAYRVQNKSKISAAYMYGKSVEWGFKALKYDVGNDAFVSNLQVISERYSKMSYVLPKESDDCLYSEKLAEAFKNAAENYSTLQSSI